MSITPAVRAVFTVVATVTFTAIIMTRGAAGRHGNVVQEHVTGPETWIPFTYEAIRLEDGVESSSYTMYRASDGSTRREQHDGQSIEIANLKVGRFYRYENGTWYDHPARRQANGGRPFFTLARETVIEVGSDDPRVSTLSGSGVTCSFVLKGDAKASRIFCPELTLLEVYSKLSHGGHLLETVLTRLTIGEPTVAFLPPSATSVIQRQNAEGPGYVSRTESGMMLRDGRVATPQR